MAAHHKWTYMIASLQCVRQKWISCFSREMWEFKVPGNPQNPGRRHKVLSKDRHLSQKKLYIAFPWQFMYLFHLQRGRTCYFTVLFQYSCHPHFRHHKMQWLLRVFWEGDSQPRGALLQFLYVGVCHEWILSQETTCTCMCQGIHKFFGHPLWVPQNILPHLLWITKKNWPPLLT